MDFHTQLFRMKNSSHYSREATEWKDLTIVPLKCKSLITAWVYKNRLSLITPKKCEHNWLIVTHHKSYLNINFCRYDIMLKCWDEQPHNRPTFKQLRSKFDAMLLADKKEAYIDLRIDQSKSYYQNLTPVTNSDDVARTGGSSTSLNLHPKSTPNGKEYSPKLTQTDRDLSPSPSANAVDQVSSREHLISERQAQAACRGPASERNRTYQNTGRPVSMYISRDKKKRQNPYVDEPSKVAATALTLPNTNRWPEHWGSEGTITGMNPLENVERWSREPQNCPEIEICPCED